MKNYTDALIEDYKQNYIEPAKPIDLRNCKMISSDVIAPNGETEKSACLIYNDTLTRVAGKVLIFRDGVDGKEVLMRFWRQIVELPGGSFDITKDNFDIINTIKREVLEELNITLTNIKPTQQNFWEFADKPWVQKHINSFEDRWLGYYTFIYTADYAGSGNNVNPEEYNNFKWYKVSDILALNSNSKKVAIFKNAIIANNYDKQLSEDIQLTEGKQVGLVSYCIHDTSKQSAIKNLADILDSEIILASTEADGDKYISTSRDLVGHLGITWKCGIILDGDKLADRYKIKPVDYNSLIYFADNNNLKSKQLQLRAVSKYEAEDNKDLCFYVIDINGSRFLTEISEFTYNIFKLIMLAFNKELAVQEQEPGKGGSDKYKGRTMGDVKKFTTKHPARYNRIMQDAKLPQSKKGHKWRCVESCGYNVENSSLILTATKLEKYKNLIFSTHNIDITSQDFFRQFVGKYADEAEERITAKLIDLVDKLGTEATSTIDNKVYGLNITNCIKGIMINIKHKPAFDSSEEQSIARLADENGDIIPNRKDNIPNIKQLATSIKEYANKNNIPIIFWNNKTTNKDIINKL